MIIVATISISLGILLIFVNWKFGLSNKYLDYFTNSYSEDIFKGTLLHAFRGFASKKSMKRWTAAEVYLAGLSLIAIGVISLIIGHWIFFNTILLISVGFVFLHFMLAILWIFRNESR